MPPIFVEHGKPRPHPLETALGTPAWDILDAIERGFRVQADVKGKLAEWHLYHGVLIPLRDREHIADVVWSDKDGEPDFNFTFRGRKMTLECKNIRSAEEGRYADGTLKLELQKTRHQSSGDKTLRGYTFDRFDVITACMFNQTESWTFLHAATRDLPRFEGTGNLKTYQRVPRSPAGVWKGTLLEVLDELAPEVKG